jgi:hypothetical protein
MATYAELYELRANSDLRNKVAVAVAVKAQTLLDAASPTAAQVTWANAAISNPNGKADVLLNYVLAKNKALTVVQINAATDAGIQTAVDGAVDKLIAGGA